MEIKKSPKADLEGKKGVFFEIGLTLALAVLLFAFEWKSSTEQVTPFQTPAEEQIEDEENMVKRIPESQRFSR